MLWFLDNSHDQSCDCMPIQVTRLREALRTDYRSDDNTRSESMFVSRTFLCVCIYDILSDVACDSVTPRNQATPSALADACMPLLKFPLCLMSESVALVPCRCPCVSSCACIISRQGYSRNDAPSLCIQRFWKSCRTHEHAYVRR